GVFIRAPLENMLYGKPVLCLWAELLQKNRNGSLKPIALNCHFYPKIFFPMTVLYNIFPI
ncbi:MAG: hypothetical protein NC412_14795, partial [Roseburia sp.]|nr:hypothetical protein [Roseburia sp.]MCM1280059.1 hypothetical protein [Robinsoniella sp.]